MARPPKYGHHRSSGRVRIRIDGKAIYLGRFNSPESLRLYAEHLARWQAQQNGPLVQMPSPALTEKL